MPTKCLLKFLLVYSKKFTFMCFMSLLFLPLGTKSREIRISNSHISGLKLGVGVSRSWSFDCSYCKDWAYIFFQLGSISCLILLILNQKIYEKWKIYHIDVLRKPETCKYSNFYTCPRQDFMFWNRSITASLPTPLNHIFQSFFHGFNIFNWMAVMKALNMYCWKNYNFGVTLELYLKWVP